MTDQQTVREMLRRAGIEFAEKTFSISADAWATSRGCVEFRFDLDGNLTDLAIVKNAMLLQDAP